MLTPEILYYFDDELEKQAFIGPSTALKLMGSKNKHLRALGKKIGDVNEFAARPENIKLVEDVHQGLTTVGPGYAGATLKGDLVRRAIKPVVGDKVSKAVTWEYKNSPFAKALLPFSGIIDRGYDMLSAGAKAVGL